MHATNAKAPPALEMHWGTGQIVEEAGYLGEYHESCIQLMQYDEGDGPDNWTIRFCSYSPRGGFQRSPLMVSAQDLEGLRQALKSTPRLRDILKRLVA